MDSFGLLVRVQLRRAGNGCYSPRYRVAGGRCQAKMRHASPPPFFLGFFPFSSLSVTRRTIAEPRPSLYSSRPYRFRYHTFYSFILLSFFYFFSIYIILSDFVYVNSMLNTPALNQVIEIMSPYAYYHHIMHFSC